MEKLASMTYSEYIKYLSPYLNSNSNEDSNINTVDTVDAFYAKITKRCHSCNNEFIINSKFSLNYLSQVSIYECKTCCYRLTFENSSLEEEEILRDFENVFGVSITVQSQK